jgi:hypothetical protein
MAAPAAGQKITAAMLGQLTNNTTQKTGAAQTTGTLTMTTSAQDLTGTSLTFSVVYACTVMIYACFDVTMIAAAVTAGDVFVGTCVVDGGTVSGEAHLNAGRATVFQEWEVALAAGSHTIKLQGQVTATTGGATTTGATHTKWHIWVPSP